MMTSEIVTLIQTLGMPIVMVLWFMFRMEKIIEKNTAAITLLKSIEAQELEVLRQLTGKLIRMNGDETPGH